MRIANNALHGCQFDSWWCLGIQVRLQSGFYANPISIQCPDLKVVKDWFTLDVLSSGIYDTLEPLVVWPG